MTTTFFTFSQRLQWNLEFPLKAYSDVINHEPILFLKERKYVRLKVFYISLSELPLPSGAHNNEFPSTLVLSDTQSSQQTIKTLPNFKCRLKNLEDGKDHFTCIFKNCIIPVKIVSSDIIFFLVLKCINKSLNQTIFA